MKRQTCLISKGLFLHICATFAAALVSVATMNASQPQSALAPGRRELWFVVHEICLPVYRSFGVAFPCTEVNIANELNRGFAVLQASSTARHHCSFKYSACWQQSRPPSAGYRAAI